MHVHCAFFNLDAGAKFPRKSAPTGLGEASKTRVSLPKPPQASGKPKPEPRGQPQAQKAPPSRSGIAAPKTRGFFLHVLIRPLRGTVDGVRRCEQVCLGLSGYWYLQKKKNSLLASVTVKLGSLPDASPSMWRRGSHPWISKRTIQLRQQGYIYLHWQCIGGKRRLARGAVYNGRGLRPQSSMVVVSLTFYPFVSGIGKGVRSLRRG